MESLDVMVQAWKLFLLGSRSEIFIELINSDKKETKCGLTQLCSGLCVFGVMPF